MHIKGGTCLLLANPTKRRNNEGRLRAPCRGDAPFIWTPPRFQSPLRSDPSAGAGTDARAGARWGASLLIKEISPSSLLQLSYDACGQHGSFTFAQQRVERRSWLVPSSGPESPSRRLGSLIQTAHRATRPGASERASQDQGSSSGIGMEGKTGLKRHAGGECVTPVRRSLVQVHVYSDECQCFFFLLKKIP